MLFVNVFLCKRRRRPWCYVKNGMHPWHRPAQVPGTCEHGSVQLQLCLDFLQCTSPRHQDDLVRTSHTQRLQTKLNKGPVWVCKAQNTAEARGSCCISLYGCMCCTSLQDPNLQERANIFRTKLQKAHVRNCTAYHSPTSCVWGRNEYLCMLSCRQRQWLGLKRRSYGQHTLLSPSCSPSAQPPPWWHLAVLALECSEWSNWFLLDGVCPCIPTATQRFHQE